MRGHVISQNKLIIPNTKTDKLEVKAMDNHDIVRLKTELRRYKELYEDTNQKTTYMKETINQLIGEIEKLNQIIQDQDKVIEIQRDKLEKINTDLDEQKQEKQQLLSFLHKYQEEKSGSTMNEHARELVRTKSGQLETELMNIKRNYQLLTELHQQEITKLQAELAGQKHGELTKQEIRIFQQPRLSVQIEHLEQQLQLMSVLLDQKQEELDSIQKNASANKEIRYGANTSEELLEQVEHLKQMLLKSQQEFEHYKQNVAQRDSGVVTQEIFDSQIYQLKKKIQFLEDQNNMLRQSHGDQQVNLLLKDLSQLRSENQKLKEKFNKSYELNKKVVELTNELRQSRQREKKLQHQLKEIQAPKDVYDDRISGLLNVVQSLQIKNEQLQHYLTPETSNGHRLSPKTVSLRQDAPPIYPSGQRIQSEQNLITFSPSRQLYHRSTPSVNLRK